MPYKNIEDKRRWGREYARKWRAANPERSQKTTQEWLHRTGRRVPMSENKQCASYLGVYIAESIRLLTEVFGKVQKMPYGNKGFDLICGKNKRIDIKCACISYDKGNSTSWGLKINKNAIAEYFWILLFDNRRSLTPMHAYLIPAHKVNHLVNLRISNNPKSLAKWSQYEFKLDKAAACCSQLKELGVA
jgi:hypothetical protein